MQVTKKKVKKSLITLDYFIILILYEIYLENSDPIVSNLILISIILLFFLNNGI